MTAMTITKIREQKNGRFAVYVDGEYVLSADKRSIDICGITNGAQISQQELDTLAATANEQKATDRAMTILSYRDHSKQELKRKLERTLGEEQAEKTVQKMEDLGLVNDDAYAEKLAAELLDRRLMGADRAVFEMTRRGIDRRMASEIVERLDINPQERISRFLSKKYPNGLDDEKVYRRAVSALTRNGFRWDDIRQVLREFDTD